MNPQLSRLENSRSLQESSSSVEATSALNEIVALQGQHINVFGGNLIELMLSGIAIDGMREPSNAHTLSQTEPLHIRKMNTPEASIRAQENWAKAFSAVRQLVKGAFKDCLVLKDSYYPEALDIRHEYIGVQKDGKKCLLQKMAVMSIISNFWSHTADLWLYLMYQPMEHH